MKTWLIHITLIGMSISSFAQERSVTVQTDREEIMIGEQIQMTLTIQSSAADTVMFPLIGDTLRKQVEVLSRSKVDTSFEGAQLDQKVLTQSFILTSFDSGYFPVEPLLATINGDTFASNPFLVGVQTMKIDTTKGIVDIKEIEEVPFAWKEWIQENWPWMGLIILALALITMVSLYFAKEREKPEPVAPSIPTRPAHELALERLDRLREEELWQQGKIKEYYSELTEILRAFIEDRFAIPAMEQTTDEIVQAMRHYPDFTDENRTKVKRLLFLADLVKFAKEKPIGQENETHFTTVEEFVREFVPVETALKKEDQDV